MRWDNLKIDTDEGAAGAGAPGGPGRELTLPGYGDPAVIRRFDAPEALDMRFYEVRAKSVLNKVPEQSQMPFRWTVNPYRGCSHACTYCFARPTHTYLDMDAGRDFEREIVVKVNAPEVLAAQLRKPRWAREHVAMGTNTDPYQWVESKYRLMPGIWAALRDTRTPCSVLTKSPLLLRDVALMQEVAKVTTIHANLSIPTLDREAWRASEPHTPSPRARLEAVAELNRAGIPTGILVAPLMPGINDAPYQVEEVLQAAADAGAVGVSGLGLHLRGEVRGVFMDWLRSYRPDLVERYEELYDGGAYLPPEERRRLSGLLRRAPAGAPWLGAGRIPGFRRDAQADGGPPAASPAGARGALRGIRPGDGVRRRGSPPLRPVEVQTALF